MTISTQAPLAIGFHRNAVSRVRQARVVRTVFKATTWLFVAACFGGVVCIVLTVSRASMVMMALFFGHIYMGTVGVRGAYKGMKTGYVTDEWAREHHELWHQDIQSGKIPAQRSKPVQLPEGGAEALPATRPCGAMARAVVFGITKPWATMACPRMARRASCSPSMAKVSVTGRVTV